MSQMISHRRELGNCRICWYTDAVTDVQIAGAANAGVADSKVSLEQILICTLLRF